MQETEILTVTQLTKAIKEKLETAFFSIQVQGEILNFKQQSSGHLYFTLKDAESQISAVLFRGQAQKLKILPKNGDQVIVQGEINVYAPRGNYQLIIRELSYAGVGELLFKLHQLKTQLEAKGLFDPIHKKPIPLSPKTIGVITSPTGAVIQDILHVLSRRHAGFHLILNPVKVQGEGAAQEIAQAIDQFNHYQLVDVIILCRGGGSLEDLWPFNEEIVAQAIFRSKIPIISAVGHETDFCISDFVSDIRAPTPSAAAEIVLAAAEQKLYSLKQILQRLQQSISHSMILRKQKLQSLSLHPMMTSPYAFVEHTSQLLDELSEKMSTSMEWLLSTKKLKIQGLRRQLENFDPLVRVQYLKKQFQQLKSHLEAINPKNLLKKGYSIVFHEKSDSIIFSKQELQLEDTIRVLTQDGEFKAKIYEI